MKKPRIGVIIASSSNRNVLLFSRSLYSVLSQNRSPDHILIVDDNQNESASKDIERRILELKNNKIHYIKNSRTPHMSGTGAWNSGIKWYEKIFTEDDYVAILDDDDSWCKEYINSCYDAVTSSLKTPDAVFGFIKRSDCDICSFFGVEDININNFLKGNPGIQGSNMFFRFGALRSIGGFDETLASCTDRDTPPYYKIFLSFTTFLSPKYGDLYYMILYNFLPLFTIIFLSQTHLFLQQAKYRYIKIISNFIVKKLY